tara:strand:+ start:459 stop:830 length:372 start_codon:yes stop_codon:yes gene_type:complete
MKLNHNKYKKNYKNYILNSISSEGYNIKTNSDKDKINFFIDTFKKEYDFMIDRVGIYKALTEYLAGLPSTISLPIYNHDILKLAINMGSVNSELSEKQEDNIINNYYNFMANIILSIHKTLNK